MNISTLFLYIFFFFMLQEKYKKKTQVHYTMKINYTKLY